MNKQIRIIVIILISMYSSVSLVQSSNECSGVSNYVNPVIDTHSSRWFFFSSASRPFGMVSLSPDMRTDADWKSGYLYDSTEIRCFSHVHCWQLSGIPVMPTTGEMRGQLGFEANKSAYSHSTEYVKPGYHKIHLDRYNVDVELTSTMRVGFHRYHFPKGERCNVLFDVGAYLAFGPMLEAEIRKVDSKELRGYSVLAPTWRRKKPIKVYFVAQLNSPVSSFGGWELKGKEKVIVKKQSLRGEQVGGYVSFNSLNKPLLMKVAISYVSEEQALLNLKTELPHWDFDRVVKESYDSWNEALGTIEVEGGSEKEKIKFYTDLWHSQLGRHTFSDVNGKFVDNTGAEPLIRQVPLDAQGKPERATYNSDAFWGSEFNLNILWSLAYPKRMSEFVSTLVDYYPTGGLIARGPSGGNYTFVMVGDQAIPLITAAYNKGIRDFDVKMAFEGCLKNSEPGGIRDYAGYESEANKYMQHYVAKGFVPENTFGKGLHQEGCAMTLYFSYEDWCMGQFAKGLGKDSIFNKYDNRSFNYRYMYDATVGWMRPRNSDGTWLTPFAPVGRLNEFNMPGFVESNSAIFTYYVPQNIPDLIHLIGGNKAFVEKLSKQFAMAAPNNFISPHGKHAQNWVDYENQPSLHLAHLFSHAQAPWSTQYWVRKIKKEVFGDITPYGGYNGDEDQGQMGALGVLMAIGLFDVQGGASVNPTYEITSPIFDRITIKLDSRYYPGAKLEIVAKNNSPENVYIQGVTFNGKPHNSFKIAHSDLVKGGVLEITLGPKPQMLWGID